MTPAKRNLFLYTLFTRLGFWDFGILIMLTGEEENFESVRITTGDIDKIKEIFQKCTHWGYGKEIGSETKKEHVHVLFMIYDSYKQNTLRKKLSETFGSGNGHYSFKKEGKNTIDKAMSYVIKDGVFEMFGDLKLHLDTGNVPKWVDPATLKKRKRDDEEEDFSKPSKAKHYLLGYNNLVKQSLRYRARFMAKDPKAKDLSHVLAHMYVHSDWRLSATILKQGIPKTLCYEFTASVDHKMEDRFTDGYFNMMIRDDAHDNRDKW